MKRAAVFYFIPKTYDSRKSWVAEAVRRLSLMIDPFFLPHFTNAHHVYGQFFFSYPSTSAYVNWYTFFAHAMSFDHFFFCSPSLIIASRDEHCVSIHFIKFHLRDCICSRRLGFFFSQRIWTNSNFEFTQARKCYAYFRTHLTLLEAMSKVTSFLFVVMTIFVLCFVFFSHQCASKLVIHVIDRLLLS